MKKIAIYDVDYTIISVNSHLAYTIYLIKKYPIKIFYFIFFLSAFLLWIFRIISTDRIKSIWLVLLKDMSYESIEKLSKEFVNNELIPKIKPNAVKNINYYKKNGYSIIFSSASFEFYIKYIAEYLKADFYYGTKIAVKNDKIMLKIEGKNCKGKEKIKRILSDIPIDQIDVNSSVSYSDSRTDIYFLEITKILFLVYKKKWKYFKILKNKKHKIK